MKGKERNLMKYDLRMVGGGGMKFTTWVKGLALCKRET